MTTAINMASNALLLIGDEPISSFGDPGAGAQVAGAVYPDVYEAVLSEHPWSFAFKELRLSRLSQAPDPETNFQYAFQLPADLIRVWAMLPHSNYVIIGGLVYSNETQLLCRYIYKVGESELPPHMVKAIEYRLAADFAVAITESVSKSQYYEQKYLRAIALARTIDSQGRPQQSIIDSPFVDVRLSGYSRGGF